MIPSFSTSFQSSTTPTSILRSLTESIDQQPTAIPTHNFHWTIQIVSLFVTTILFSSYLGYHLYTVRNLSDTSDLSSSNLICTAEPLKPWIKPFILIILGACFGQALSLYFRAGMSVHVYSTNGKLRHPNATRLMMAIATFQALCIFAFYIDLMPSTCLDFLGVRLHYFLWFEWLCTVPYLFFLVSIVDVKRQYMNRDAICIQLLGTGSLMLLFTGNFAFLPSFVHWVTIVVSNLMMPAALLWQQYNAYLEYSVAKADMEERKPSSSKNASFTTEDSNSFTWPEVTDIYHVTKCKYNSSIFMTVTFTIFHLLYYMNLFQWFDTEIYIILNYFCGYSTKVLFTYILTDAHVTILDPNKFLIVEERRKAEEARVMFLRYVFHEVRVPLNSVVLGLQLLHDNEEHARMEKETLTMMKDATTFMSETLNDALSLQKIEHGQMHLEIKPFAPKRLLRSVVSYFRPSCEAKDVKIVTHCDETIPKWLFGDQFRLEHVVSNFVSNAIKFSDPGSIVEVTARHEKVADKESGTPAKATVTFSVKDYAIGMSETDQKMLFQPFMQIRPGELQKGSGSGLGLSICKNIVELHGGIVACRSKQRVGDDRNSGGSEFYFTIAFEPVTDIGLLPDDWDEDEGREEEVEYQTEMEIEFAGDNVPLTHDVLHPVKAVSAPVVPLLDLASTVTNSSGVTSEDSDVDVITKSIRQCSGETDQDPPTVRIPTLVAVDALPSFRETEESEKNTARGRSDSIGTDRSDMSERTIGGIPRSARARTSSVTSSLSVSSISYANIGKVLVCDGKLLYIARIEIGFTDGLTYYDLDVLTNRKMLAMILSRKGVTCELAVDGAEAVSMVQEKGLDYYDIIFMDSIMPVLSGPLAAKQLRSLGYAKLLIGVTGNAMDIDIREYEDAGADMILTKPVQVHVLTKVLDFCRIHGCVSHFNYQSRKLCEGEMHSETDQLVENRRIKNWVANHM